MMTGVSGIYDEPELYQLACAYRDVPAESGALLSWLDKHAKIADGVRSVIELAAGPAEPARELAHRGLRATALDHSAAMCGYAAAQDMEAAHQRERPRKASCRADQRDRRGSSLGNRSPHH